MKAERIIFNQVRNRTEESLVVLNDDGSIRIEEPRSIGGLFAAHFDTRRVVGQYDRSISYQNFMADLKCAREAVA